MNTQNQKIIIAFDGPDNVGKGTQISLLRKWLPHIPFVLMNLDRPAGTSNSEKINYGLAASRNALYANKILAEKEIPQIVDRMHYTEYAYSLLRGGHDTKTILELEKEFIDIKDYFFTIVFIDEVQNIQDRDDGISNYNADDTNEVANITNRFPEIARASLFDNVVININGKDIPTVQSEVQKYILGKFPNILDEKQS